MRISSSGNEVTAEEEEGYQRGIREQVRKKGISRK
jgi:hypothetical protein